MGIEFQILVTPPQEKVFRSGELVTGTVKIKVDDKTIVKDVSIFLIGKLKGRHTTFETDSDLINKETFLMLTDTLSNNLVQNIMKEQLYDHHFEFQLIENLPTSYRDETCTISYKIVIEYKISDSMSERIVTEIPVYGNVKPYEEIKEFGSNKYLLLVNQPLEMRVNIKTRYLTAGDDIKLDFKISNQSYLSVTEVTAKLIAETIYKYSKKNIKVQREDVDRNLVKFPGVKKNDVVNLTCTLPTLTSLFSIQHSIFFSREYKVIVTAKIPFPFKDATVEIPVVIQMGDHVPDIELNGKHKKMGFVPYLRLYTRPLVG